MEMVMVMVSRSHSFLVEAYPCLAFAPSRLVVVQPSPSAALVVDRPYPSHPSVALVRRELTHTHTHNQDEYHPHHQYKKCWYIRAFMDGPNIGPPTNWAAFELSSSCFFFSASSASFLSCSWLQAPGDGYGDGDGDGDGVETHLSTLSCMALNRSS